MRWICFRWYKNLLSKCNPSKVPSNGLNENTAQKRYIQLLSSEVVAFSITIYLSSFVFNSGGLTDIYKDIFFLRFWSFFYEALIVKGWICYSDLVAPNASELVGEDDVPEGVPVYGPQSALCQWRHCGRPLVPVQQGQLPEEPFVLVLIHLQITRPL